MFSIFRHGKNVDGGGHPKHDARAEPAKAPQAPSQGKAVHRLIGQARVFTSAGEDLCMPEFVAIHIKNCASACFKQLLSPGPVVAWAKP